MKQLIIALVFTVNAHALDTIKVPVHKAIDFRDNIVLELDEESEYSKATLLGQNWLVKTDGNIVSTLLKLQAKEITISQISHRDFTYLVGLTVLPNKK